MEHCWGLSFGPRQQLGTFTKGNMSSTQWGALDMGKTETHASGPQCRVETGMPFEPTTFQALRSRFGEEVGRKSVTVQMNV